MAIYASLANNNIYASLSFDIEFPPHPLLNETFPTEIIYETKEERTPKQPGLAIF